MEIVGKDKAIPICPYLFYMYKEQQVLFLGDVVIYNVGMEFVKYNGILDPDPTSDPSKLEQGATPDPQRRSGTD